MEKLLPYYERELSLLRRAFRDFAHRFPKLAGKLGLSGEHCSDPGIERLIQGTALLNARLARKLDRGYERFTNDLLSIQSPFYLRPIPACSVVQVDGAGARAITTVPRGTELRTRATPACGFRTVYDVNVAPLAVTVRFSASDDAPAMLGLPAGIGCSLAITIETTDPAVSLEEATSAPLRVFIDAEGSTRAALHDALFMRTLCTCVESEEQWRKLPALPLAPVGFSDDEALLPTPWRQDESLRLLTEYFAFPEKFAFFDIDLKAALAGCAAGTRRVVLHLLLPDMHRTTTPDLLRTLSATALRLNCTPVINMFSRAAAPIRLRQGRNTYPVTLPRTGDARATVYSFDAMKLLRSADDGCGAIAMDWFYERKLQTQHCWVFELANEAYGTEDTVSFVDRVHEPLELDKGTVDVRVTCTNGDLPCSLPIGRTDGDLTGDPNLGGRPIRMLCKPSTPLLLADHPNGHWEAIAVGHANHRGQTQVLLSQLHALLRLHARPECAVAARQLSGIVGVSRRAIQEWLKFKVGAGLTYGSEITLTIDDAAFAERSIFAFAQVMERVFSYYITYPHFLRLNVQRREGEVLVRGALRHGFQSVA